VPVIASMAATGPVTQTVLWLVAGSQRLRSQWNDGGAWQVMLTAGFPESTMNNLTGQTFGTDPDCCAQLKTWLQSISFPSDGETPDAGWWACTLCKATLTGLALAGFVVLVSICLGGVGAPVAGVLATLESSTAVATIQAALDVSSSAVAKVVFAAFAAGGVASFVASLIEKLCELTGLCESHASATA